MHQEGSFAATMISTSAKVLAAGVMDRQSALDPGMVPASGPALDELIRETELRLCHLAQALACNRVILFTDHLAWLKVWNASRGISANALSVNLECMVEELEDRLPEGPASLASAMMKSGISQFLAAPSEVSSYLEGDAPYVDLARKFLLAVLESRETDAFDLVMEAFAGGATITDLHKHVLQRVQVEMGRMWQMGETTIAEEHYCTGIVTSLLAMMRSKSDRATASGRRVITANVNNETHSIGIQLVSQAFESQGWSVIGLGSNTPVIAIAEAVRDFGCDVIALSVNIVLYVRQTADLIATLRSHPLTANVPILVGGQPFNLVDDLWKVVGADGFASSALDSPVVAERLACSSA